MKNSLIWKDTGFVFTEDDNTPMYLGSITYWLGIFSKAEDLPHIHPHLFRRTAASTMIANGIDLVTTAAKWAILMQPQLQKFTPTRLRKLVPPLPVSVPATLQQFGRQNNTTPTLNKSVGIIRGVRTSSLSE